MLMKIVQHMQQFFHYKNTKQHIVRYVFQPTSVHCKENV